MLDAMCPKSCQMRLSQYVVAVVWTFPCFPSRSCQTLALQFLSLLNSIKQDVVVMNAYEQGWLFPILGKLNDHVARERARQTLAGRSKIVSWWTIVAPCLEVPLGDIEEVSFWGGPGALFWRFPTCLLSAKQCRFETRTRQLIVICCNQRAFASLV